MCLAGQPGYPQWLDPGSPIPRAGAVVSSRLQGALSLPSHRLRCRRSGCARRPLHVKRFRLRAVLGAWDTEQIRLSYTVTKHECLVEMWGDT